MIKERVFFEEFDSLYYFHGSSQNWAMQGFHFHNQYEIILFLSDGASLEVGNSFYQVQAGDLFLLNNKEYHRTNGAEGKPHNRYVLMFEPEMLIQLAQAFGYDFSMFFERRADYFIHKLHLDQENLKKIEHSLGNIEKNIRNKGSDESDVKLKLSILYLIAEINEMYQFFMINQNKDNAEDTDEKQVDFKNPVLYRERIEQIKKYISAHVEDRLELDDIAREFYMSRYYLSHYFKRETGFTLLSYITAQKINTAKSMLKQGLSVTDVAMKLSYNSDSHFIAVFKKNTGMTPKKYASEKNGNNV